MKKRFYQFIGSALTACLLLSDLGTMAVYAAPRQNIGTPGIEEQSIEETVIENPGIEELKIGEPNIEEQSIGEPVIEEPGDGVDKNGEGEWAWLGNVSVNASAGSYTAEVKAVFGSEDDDWETKASLEALSPILVYTDDTTKDLFSGKDGADSLDAYQQMGSTMRTEYINSNGETKTRIYALFNLSENGPLKPGTKYRYRIALPDQDRYYFATDVSSFTTGAGVTRSAVNINDITIMDYGYEAERIRFRISDPDDELIISKHVVDGEGNELPEFYIWPVDEYVDPDGSGEDKGRLYETMVPTSPGVTIRLVVYTGEEAVETNIDHVLSADEIKKRDTNDCTISACFNELVSGIETDFTVDPVYEVDDYRVTLYYKKTTESAYREFIRPMEDEERVLFSVTDMEMGQEYQYYLTLTSPFRTGEILYQSGSAEEPFTIQTGALVTYTRDDFMDKALYDELKARGYELTNVSLGTCEYLNINGISGSTPISSLEDIPGKMPSLQKLEIIGHDITDITPLLSVKGLKNIDLSGNELKKLPNLSGVKWEFLGLAGTYVTNEELRIKAGFSGAADIADPREKEPDALKTVYTDDAGKFPLVLRYDGRSDSRRYTFTVSMGSVTRTYNSDDEGVYYYDAYNYGTFVIPDIRNDFSLETEKDYSFRVTIKDAYHTDPLCDKTFNIRFETPEYEPGDEYITPGMATLYLDQTLSADTLKEGENPYRAEIRKGEKVYYVSDELEMQSGNICAELYRDLTGWNSYRVESAGNLVYNAVTVNEAFSRVLIPSAGDYDLYYYDESGKQLLKVEGKIHISTDPVVVASQAPVYGYGNNEKYLYVQIFGQNLSFTKAPVITDGTETFTEVLSVRKFERARYLQDETEGYYGFDKYVFKLKKKNWDKILAADPSQEYSLLIDGNKVTDLRPEEEKKVRAAALQGKSSSEIYLSSAEYNWKKDAFEFSFRAPIAAGSLISAEIGNWDYDKNEMNEQAGGSGRIDENGVLSMHFYDASGAKYVPVDGSSVYVRFSMDEKAFSDYPEEFRISFYNYFTGPIYGSDEGDKYVNSSPENRYLQAHQTGEINDTGEGFVVTDDSVRYSGGGTEAALFITAPYIVTDDVDKNDIPAFVEAKKLELKIYDIQRKPVSVESAVSQVSKSGIIGWEIRGLDPEAGGYYFAVTADGQVPTDIDGNKLYRKVEDWDEDNNEIYGDDPCGKWYGKDPYVEGVSLKDGYDGVKIDDGWGNAPYKLRFYRVSQSATLITEITIRADQLKDETYYLTGEDTQPLDPEEIYLCTVMDSKEKVIGTLVGYFRSEPDRFSDDSEPVQLKSIEILNKGLLFVGETRHLSVKFTPADASNKTISWSSSDPAVATISNYGYVTAASEGQTTITLKSTDTEVKPVIYVLQVIDSNKVPYVEFEDKGPYVYSGEKITPAVAVYYGGKKMTEGVNYKLSYSNNINANDKSKVKVTGITIPGSVEKEFTISPRSIDGSEVKEVGIVVDSGKKVTPTLYLRNHKLTSKDFTYDKSQTFTENGSITVSGKGNFKGSRVIDVTVGTPLKFKVSSFKAIKRTYNGQDQKLTAGELTVVDSKTSAVLEEGTDYILSYPEDLCSAGIKTFCIIGIGKYNCVIVKSYKIEPLKASLMHVDSPLRVVYHPGAVTPEVKVYQEVKVNGSLTNQPPLIPNVDYTLKFSNNKKVGKASVKVRFTGNYKGTSNQTKTFDIDKASINANNVSIYCPNLAWTKNGKYVSTPIVTMDGVNLDKKDYTVSYTLNGEDITQKKLTQEDLGADNSVVINVTVEGKNNMEGKATTTYRVVYSPKESDLSKAKAEIFDSNGKKKSVFPYTGLPIEITGDYQLKVELNNLTLEEGKDYKVEYANNVNKGKATVILTGLGETGTGNTKYYGSKTIYFSIYKGTLSWH